VRVDHRTPALYVLEAYVLARHEQRPAQLRRRPALRPVRECHDPDYVHLEDVGSPALRTENAVAAGRIGDHEREARPGNEAVRIELRVRLMDRDVARFVVRIEV